MKYFINYGTGTGDEYVEGTLDEAKKVAEDGLSYTQTDVSIQSEDGEDVAILKWYGVQPNEDDIVTAQFGDYGFYSGWTER